MYTQKDFTHLIGLAGFSDTMLTNHMTLYKGYVDNVNAMLTKMNEIRLERLDGNETRKIETQEMHRRYGWEYNGMKLHELYFGAMTKESEPLNIESNLYKKLVERYGSYENFITHFKTSVGLFRGIGWVALIQREDTLGVIWIGEHDEGVLANSNILLVMDMWEHAYMTDYGIKKADYIESFIKAIDWKVVEERYNS